MSDPKVANYLRAAYQGEILEIDGQTTCIKCAIDLTADRTVEDIDAWLNEHAFSFSDGDIEDLVFANKSLPSEHCARCRGQVYHVEHGDRPGSVREVIIE